MMQRIIVKNPAGATLYYTYSITDAKRYIRNHEISEGLSGLTFDIENV